MSDTTSGVTASNSNSELPPSRFAPIYQEKARGRDAQRQAHQNRGRAAAVGQLCATHGCVRPATVGIVLIVTVAAQRSMPTDVVTYACVEHAPTALPEDVTTFRDWSRIEKWLRRTFGRDLAIDPKTVGRRAVPLR